MIITDMYYGAHGIVAAYLGTELVFEKGCSIRRARLEAELDVQGNVVALHAVPVWAETEITLNVEAEAMTRPVAPASAECGITVGVESAEVHVPEAVPAAHTEDGIVLGIEAEVYVFNKAEIGLEEGVTLQLDAQPLAGECVPAELDETVSVDLEAQGAAPDAVPFPHEGNAVQLEIEGIPDTADACPMAAEAKVLELGIDGTLHALDICQMAALFGIELGIEAIVTVLDAAAVTVELEMTMDASAEVADKTSWIYPEDTGEYLYIRQVCQVVQEET